MKQKRTPFQEQLAIFHDPKSTEVQKAVAKVKLDNMEEKRMEWNKKNNPQKYYADMAKKVDKQNDFVLDKLRSKVFDKNGELNPNASENDKDEFIKEAIKRSERSTYYHNNAMNHKFFKD